MSPLRIARAFVAASFIALSCVVPAFANADVPATFDASDAFVYVPATERVEPLQVVVALHGMGGEGKGFCQSFLNAAEKNGWVVVAPTFKYRNWRDPATVADDDVALTRSLATYLDELPRLIGRPTTERAMFVGFSRGAQLAHRFALAYPEKTRAVAAMSAGTYTVPTAESAFPFGTSDLPKRLERKIDQGKVASVDFWVAVGADDNKVEDVPRQWDRLGSNRVARAQSFAKAIKAAGAPTEIAVYERVGHAMSPEMVRGATRFIERVTVEPPFQSVWRYWGVGLAAL